MPKGRRLHQVPDPLWKVLNPAPFSISLILLFLACWCKGVQNQISEYNLSVPASVSVQRGLCVHIPCRFTYEQKDRLSNQTLYGYWFQSPSRYWGGFHPRYAQYVRGILVATNDKVAPAARNRFQLTGKPEEGDCSFRLLDAKSEDTGEYYFQTENIGVPFKTRLFHRTHRQLEVVVTEFREKPLIQQPSAALSGKQVVLTCSVPGPCTKIEPSIYWSDRLTGHTSDVWSLQHSNGSWTYGSNFTFAPSPDEQEKLLTCYARYPNTGEVVENSILIDIADPPKTVEISTNATDNKHLALCSPRAKEDLSSIVAREGETISLQCHAQSRPNPVLNWMKGREILRSTRQGQKHLLLLSDIRAEDAGEYLCRASIPGGSANRSIHLCVLSTHNEVWGLSATLLLIVLGLIKVLFCFLFFFLVFRFSNRIKAPLRGKS